MISGLEEKRILTLDSSSMSGSVSLCHGATPVAELFLNVHRTHSENLLQQVDLLLDKTGWSLTDLDLLAAVTGPGSFTGLRIGIAMIKGLAQVLNIPVVSVSALQAIAANIPYSNLPVCVFLDARKREVYTQLFHWDDDLPLPLNQARVIAPEKLLAEIVTPTLFIGNGVFVYKDLLFSHGDRVLVAPPSVHQLRANQASWLALKHWSQGKALTAAEMLPTYIRPSDAELNLTLKQSPSFSG